MIFHTALMVDAVDVVRMILGIIALPPCAYCAWKAIHEDHAEKQKGTSINPDLESSGSNKSVTSEDGGEVNRGAQKTWIINVLLWMAIGMVQSFRDGPRHRFYDYIHRHLPETRQANPRI